MPRAETKANPFKKITGDVAFDAGQTDEGAVRAIFKVNAEGYVPKGVTVRSKIDETMFTGEFDTRLLSKLDRDSNVESVAVSRRLRIID
ncbi:MAG TPA: hypothetical protein VEW71_07605 [Allosphingosinicella sp.]|nr:hypothetical protein [Allosphingosinicella sp.]